jgi:hypothetical protein
MIATAGCGGLMTDYDVMNLSCDPKDMPSDEVALFDDHRVPCMVWATRPATIVDEIMLGRYEKDQFHMSDMLWSQQTTFPIVPGILLPFGAPNWRRAKAVHFSHHDVKRNHMLMKRPVVIRKELPFLTKPKP